VKLVVFVGDGELASLCRRRYRRPACILEEDAGDRPTGYRTGGPTPAQMEIV